MAWVMRIRPSCLLRVPGRSAVQSWCSGLEPSTHSPVMACTGYSVCSVPETNSRSVPESHSHSTHRYITHIYIVGSVESIPIPPILWVRNQSVKSILIPQNRGLESSNRYLRKELRIGIEIGNQRIFLKSESIAYSRNGNSSWLRESKIYSWSETARLRVAS